MRQVRTQVTHSAVDGVVWPAVPSSINMQRLALLQQFEHSQWWPTERIEQHQFSQLGRLLEHAYQTNAFYRERLAAVGYRPGQAITADFWHRIPVLDRSVVRERGDELRTVKAPESHGRLLADATSGSTGRPVRIVKTELNNLFWDAVTLREELWQRRDLSLPLAAIRKDSSGRSTFPEGVRHETWGFPAGGFFRTGPGYQLDNLTPIDQQVDWLIRRNPGYLVTFPSIVAEIARVCRAGGFRLPNLRGIKTVGEVVDTGLRALCRETFGLEVADLYSAVETGYLALQCPKSDHYHVQSEVALVEVLHETAQPCAPGEVGDVVVTVLHNFAMPLIRYSIGDRAEVGPSCACGRGLPVITRILGRSRDLVTLPSGERRFGVLSFDKVLNEIPAVIQGQVVQKTIEHLEVRLVAKRHLSAEEEAKISDRLIRNYKYSFRVTFTYCDAIPRSSTGKFFDFLSELPT